MRAVSPLRYPGGKQLLGGVLQRLIRENDLEGGVYAEPYAGGAAAGLMLLFSEYVNRLILNDADPSIYAMWTSILHDTDGFCRLVRDTPLSVEQWKQQRRIYFHPHEHNTLEVGFAAFYLNRTNRSGIINTAGPIGGNDQTGIWKINARFNRIELVRRIERIAVFRNRITFFVLDAIDFIANVNHTPKLFMYLDPPYFLKGRKLYLNYYRSDDHKALARFIKHFTQFKWVMTYDRAEEIRSLYKGFRQVPFALSYSATQRRRGRELLILSKGLRFPHEWRKRLPAAALRH